MTTEKRWICWVLWNQMVTVPRAILAVPLTLASETLWKSAASSCPPPRLPSATPPRLSHLSRDHLPYLTSPLPPPILYLTLFTHSFLWNSVSCCLRGTFPRLFLCLSDRSSFYFLAFTPSLTQQRVSILSWLFSWAYSVFLAILSTCTHHLSLVPDGSQV